MNFLNCPSSIIEATASFHRFLQAPFLKEFLEVVLECVPVEGTACEIFSDMAFVSVWLSQRTVWACGVTGEPGAVEKIRPVNDALGGKAQFSVCDPLRFVDEGQLRHDVVHHHEWLHRFSMPYIQAFLAQQVARARKVVFAVPSVFVPRDPEAEERFLPIEEWKHILEPFQVLELRYIGDPRFDELDHILCVLEGQEADEKLRRLMTVPDEPFPMGISAIVHTRNEARHIEECLKTLQGWVDEIIVCDMESRDETVAIASRYTNQILSHPHIVNFDRARNVSAMRAKYRWVFYLDADERVPSETGRQIREIALSGRTDFDCLAMPFRHIFSGRWLRHIYPGYKAPQLFKNGRFFYNTALHAGASVPGRAALFPADNPDLALIHYSHDNITHYLDKINGYTDGEALNLWNAGQPFDWRAMVRDFVRDASLHYDRKNALLDEGYGLIYSLCSGFYRLISHAKLYERRDHAGQLTPTERQVPPRLEDVLEYALALLRQPAPPRLKPLQVARHAPRAVSTVWSGPMLSPSGYGEQSRHHVLGLNEAEVPLAIQILPWDNRNAQLDEKERGRLQNLEAVPVEPGFTHIIHDFPDRFTRHPQAGFCIGRTVFETDRVPQHWVNACNQMDAVWVSSEFNRRTFAAAGVDDEKLRVIPECINAHEFENLSPSRRIESLRPQAKFIYLSVFDWTLHKGWDVLLEGFLRAFDGRGDVALVLKVSSYNGLTLDDIRSRAADWARAHLGHDLLSDTRIHLMGQHLTRLEILELYRAADAYVLPSRGEGWGRPYMEAMACGKPTIGTGWGGNVDFMTPENSYLIDYEITDVSEAGWRELPTFKGHRWAQPKLDHLVTLLRQVEENREEARMIGEKARHDVIQQFNAEHVGKQIQVELQRIATFKRESSSKASGLETNPCSNSVSVRWEGTQFVWHSLAHVNREVCRQLLNHPDIELSLVPFEPDQFSPRREMRFQALAERQFAPLSQPAAVHIRHFFPPRFNAPSEGHLVLMQGWEFGFLPRRWVAPIQENVAEVWCYSQYQRSVFVESGIEAAKVQIVPLGVDTAIDNPQAPPYVFTTEAGADRMAADLSGEGVERREQPFVFLFVGGTIPRKGVDILLEAYFKAFTLADDVCLVIKDTGTATIYRGDNQREKILSFVGQKDRPVIVYLDDDLSSHQMAGLYTACNCLVQPYRGEGFCLPALEAMACGLAVLATEGGPTDDFIDESVGWRIPAQRKPVEQRHIGVEEFVAPPWWFEVEPEALMELLRYAYRNRDEVKKRGAAGAARAASHWTWQQASDVVADRIKALAVIPTSPNKQALVAEKAGANGLNDADRASNTNQTSIRRRPKVSLCMIVRNEERVLTACLESVQPWVDEIVIVDTGSTDRTVEIAESFGVRLFHFPWCDDFSRARNESLSHATGDWIFWMDADDTITAECGRQIRDLAFTAADDVSGFLAQVRIPPAPGDTGCVVVDHVKLFRNLPEVRFEGRIHEQILESIYQSGGKVERSGVHVIHSGYDYSSEGQERKRNRDLSLLQQDLEDRPNHPFVLFNIGMTAYHLKDYDRALEALEKCLAVSKPHESTVRKVYAMLAGCHLAQKNLPAARESVVTGLGFFPNDPELLFRAGIIARECGDLTGAEAAYLRLLNTSETGHIDSIDVSIKGFKARHNLGLIYRDMNRLEQAEAQWQSAINEAPHFAPSWIALGELYYTLQRFENVQRVIAKLAEIAPEQARLLSSKLKQRLSHLST